MGMLDRAIKRGVNRAVGNALGNAVSNALGNAAERKIEEAVAAPLNQAANQAVPSSAPYQPQQTQATAQTQAAAAQLGGLFAGFTGAAQSYANEAAKNMKVCPGCGEPAGADLKFCPNCGTALPANTAAQEAVCQGCGKQNNVGTKFCSDCGMKLPAAFAEENAARAKSEVALAKWETLLPQYPKWTLGGQDISLEEGERDEYGRPCYEFRVSGNGLPGLLAQYCQMLRQNGFAPAGEYPSESQLFKRINGVGYCFGCDDAFGAGINHMSVSFAVREPYGGFDYVKPEPQKPKGWKDLLGL